MPAQLRRPPRAAPDLDATQGLGPAPEASRGAQKGRTSATGAGNPSPASSNADAMDRMLRKTTDPETIYADHQKHTEAMTTELSADQANDVKNFRAHYEKNAARYEKVGKETGLPAPLIAAIHWRESHGNFNTYLHQGDPLGKPAVHEPTDIPLFTEWEPAAVHALKQKSNVAKSLAMDKDTTDLAAMATYAEFYNGLGYRQHGVESPYVYSGTDQYTGGKYNADGQFSAKSRDQQTGVLPLIESVDPGKQG